MRNYLGLDSTFILKDSLYSRRRGGIEDLNGLDFRESESMDLYFYG